MPDAKNPRLAESAAAINEANNAIARQNCAIMRRKELNFLKKWEYCAMVLLPNPKNVNAWLHTCNVMSEKGLDKAIRKGELG